MLPVIYNVGILPHMEQAGMSWYFVEDTEYRGELYGISPELGQVFRSSCSGNGMRWHIWPDQGCAGDGVPSYLLDKGRCEGETRRRVSCDRVRSWPEAF